jgi:glucokinase
MAKKKLFSRPMIGVDLGATKIYTLLVDERGNALAESKMNACGEQGGDAVLKRIASSIDNVMTQSGAGKKDIGGVGLGVPSPVDLKTGTALFSPNLGWRNFPVKARLEKQLKMRVRVDNDVNLGTLGEFTLGAGRGTRNIAGFFVGTGIGGGVIVDGKIIHGKNNTGGELGHTIILADGPLCGCGNRGCLEATASRIAITRDLQAAMSNGIPTLLNNLLAHDTDRIKSSILKKAYKDGDELVRAILDRAAWHIGIAVANITNSIGPDIVVIGGGLFEALGQQLIPIVRRSAMLHFFGPAGKDMPIALAELGDAAVALGAAVNAAARIS